MFGAPLVMVQGASVRQLYLNYVSQIFFTFSPPLLLAEGTLVHHYKEDECSVRLTYFHANHLLFGPYKQEMEIL
jgi:hypothetical protein